MAFDGQREPMVEEVGLVYAAIAGVFAEIAESPPRSYTREYILRRLAQALSDVIEIEGSSPAQQMNCERLLALFEMALRDA